MCNKHAYLIMAHDNFTILKMQLELLDNERNHFYIHIDKKAGDINKAYILENITKSKVVFIKRKNVYWADYTQTQVEIDLIKEALNNAGGGGYSWFHLLSGVDLPIKSQRDIFSFFDSSEKLYLCCGSKTSSYQEKRTRYFYPFIKSNNFKRSKTIKCVSLILGRLQGIFFINRHKNRKNYQTCYHGWNWFSVPKDFAEYVITKEDMIYSTFHHTVASDESFMQTVAMNSIYRDRIYKFDCLEESTMRRIDWKRGKPWTFKLNDYHYIMDSPYFFARKFSESVDMDIVNKIYITVKDLNKN